jgi:transcriptional regulator with XRE-family HTH domain
MQRRWVASPDYRRVIEQIKAVRGAKGLSQREVARRLGKPVSFLNKIELLERRLDIVEFVVLARALEIDPHGLLDKVLPAISDAPEF